MRKPTPNDLKPDQRDQEGGTRVASPDGPTSGLGAQTQSQAEAKTAKAKYQGAIIVGILALLSAGMIMVGASYLNLKKEAANPTTAEAGLMRAEASPIKLHEYDCSERQIILPGGACRDCHAFTRPDRDKAECIMDVCDGDNEALLVDGTCMACFPYSAPGPHKRGCVYPDCGPREKTGYDGQCEVCPDYERRGKVDIECEQPVCLPHIPRDLENGQPGQRGERLTREAICVACPAHTVASVEGDGTQSARQCTRPRCEAGERLLASGECEVCPDYTRVLRSDTECEAPRCDGLREIVTRSGDCQRCGPYEVASADNRRCVTKVCPEQHVVTHDATCQKCETGHYVDDTKRKCLVRECGRDQVRTTEGNCKDCESYFLPNTDGQSCSINTCVDHSQMIAESGECVDDYEERYNQCTREHLELELRCENWKGGCDGNEGRERELLAEIEALEAEAARNDEQIVGITAERNALRDEIENFDPRMNELQQTISRHEATIISKDGQMREINDSLTALNAQLAEKDNKVRELQLEVQKLEIEKAVECSDSIRDELERRIRDLEQQLELQEQLEQSIQNQMRDQLAAFIALQDDKTDAEGELATTQARLVALQSELDGLELVRDAYLDCRTSR